MTAAEDLLAIAQSVPSITPDMRRDPIMATQRTVDEARELGDEDDGEILDWLLRAKLLVIVTPAEMAAQFAPAKFTNRAARRARAKSKKRRK